jgi:hypothetical protein
MNVVGLKISNQLYIEMKNKAYSKYYDANREKLIADMRERDAERREAKRKHLAEHPEDVEAERQRMRDKYHKHKAKVIKTMLEQLVENPITNANTKTFIKESLLKNDVYTAFSVKAVKKMVDALVLP